MNAQKKNVQVFTHTSNVKRRNSYVVSSCHKRPTRKYLTTLKNDQITVCKIQMLCLSKQDNSC